MKLIQSYLSVFPLFIYCLFYSSVPISAQKIIWEENFGSVNEDRAYSIVPSPDEGYVFAGHSFNASTKNDFYIGKVDDNGFLQWEYTYGGSGEDIAQEIIPIVDGGYILAGSTASSDGDVTDTNNGNEDMWLVKVDANGIKQWDKTYGGSSIDRLQSISSTLDGGYILVGYSYSMDGDITDGNNGSADFCILKIDDTGNIQWNKTYGGLRQDFANSVVSTADGNFIVGGTTRSVDFDLADNFADTDGDMWVMKIDQNGNKIWDETYGGSNIDWLQDMTVTLDGNYVLAGYSSSADRDLTSNYGQEDIWVVTIDDLGTILWEKNYGGNNRDQAKSIYSTNDGGYILSGNTNSTSNDVENNHGNMDVWLLKINRNGVVVWNKNFGSTGSDIGHSVLQTSDGDYVVAGRSQFNDVDVSGNNGDYDAWIFKVSEPITDIESIDLTDITLSQNHPNPSNQLTTIRFAHIFDNMELVIVDIWGKRVFQEYIPIGLESISINTSKLDAGLYFYQLQTPQQQVLEKQKMLVIH